MSCMNEEMLIEKIKTIDDDKWILKLTKNVIESSDLNIVIEPEISEIHIHCDTLQISEKLSKAFRGKSFLIDAKTIEVFRDSLWDLSGKDGSEISSTNSAQNCFNNSLDGNDGINGQDGGNCIIINCNSIINVSNWTIQSNGGDGSSGGNGINGTNGENGTDVNKHDFKLLGKKITNTNFEELISKLDINTNHGSRQKVFYENGRERTIIFNKDSTKSELLMLIKGTKGKRGMLGGFGGQPGRGGKAGTINKKIRFYAENGRNGRPGISGITGSDGKDGSDAFMIVRSDENFPIYGGINEKLKLKISCTNVKTERSIYYKTLNVYYCAAEIQEQSSDNSTTRPISYEEHFMNALLDVLKSSNQCLSEVVLKLKIRKFVCQEISSRCFSVAITQNDFDIPSYDVLKNYAKIFTMKPLNIENQLRDVLDEFIADATINYKSENVVEIKKKLMTSEDIETITKGFDELRVICDVLHINTDLSCKFRGKNLAVVANHIYIHHQVEWNVSGRDIDQMYPINAGHDAEGKGIDGRNGVAGESGGNISISCGSIINPSFWTIKSNGSNGQDGQSGGNGWNHVNGNSPTEKDFTIDGIELSKMISSVQDNVTYLYDNNFEKQLVVESLNVYAMIIKGTNGHAGCLGGKPGAGGEGGKAGKIQLEISNISNINEIETEAIDGIDGKNGSPGESGDFHYTNGSDVVIYVNNGVKKYFGLNETSKYEFCQSLKPRKFSLHINNLYYYPKIIYGVNKVTTRLDDIIFYQNLIPVLRHSIDKFDTLISTLQLEKFVKKQIKLSDVVKNVSKNDIEVPFYQHLKKIATQYKIENENNHDFIRSEICEFIKEMEISLLSNVVEIKKKVLMSSEFTSKEFKNVQELRIICDTLHINTDFSNEFREKNVAIVCNYVEVHCPTIWDLSGYAKDVQDHALDAGQNEDGSGKDGLDGAAGRSGGNFYLSCNYIENASALTIISNGTDGISGQNGGNGKNGEDGKNAERSDFFVGDIEIKVPLDSYDKLKKSPNFISYYSDYFFARGTYKSNNGLDGFIYFKPNIVLLTLVKGGIGENGKNGGLLGFGGDAGNAGEISLRYQSRNHLDEVQKFSRQGNPGKDGLNGWNGLRGRDGRDIGKFDYGFWSEPVIIGEGAPSKLKVAELHESYLPFMLTLGSTQIAGHKIWSDEYKCYLKIEKEMDVTNQSIKQTRNDATILRSKMSHAISKKNPSIDFEVIKEKSSSYLDSSLDKISNEISRFDQELAVNENSLTTPAKSNSKSSIRIDEIKREHEAFLTLNFNEVNDQMDESNSLKLTNSETQHLKERLQISTNRQVNTDAIKMQKIGKIHRHRVVEKPFELFTYDFLKSSKTEKRAEECIQYLRKSNLNAEQYQFIMNNLQNFNIRQNEDSNSEIEHQEVDNNQLNFQKFDVKNLQSIRLIDIESVCEEKQLQLFYKEIYEQCSESFENVKAIEEISLDAADFKNQFLFLKDSKNIDLHTKELERYFNKDSKEERNEILKYFKDKCLKFDFSFSESIFNHIIKNVEKYKENSRLLEEFEEKAYNLDENIEDCQEISEQTQMDSSNTETLSHYKSAKESFCELLKNFYENKEILDLVENEILLHGMNSALYRKIFAYRFKIKLVLCRYGIDGKFKIFEWHNYDDDLRFDYHEAESNKESNSFLSKKYLRFFRRKNSEEYEQRSSETDSKEYFVLCEAQKFYLLNFQFEKYKNFKYQQDIDANFKGIAINLENIQTNSVNLYKNKCKKLSETVSKYGFIDNKFVKIFSNNEFNENSNDIDFLFKSVMSCFPEEIYAFANHETDEYKTDAERIETNQKLQDINKVAEEGIRTKIKWIFKLIAYIEGAPVLRAIAIRLFNDTSLMSLEEFMIFLKAVFTTLLRKQGFTMTLTFMILGNEQDFWIPEIILMKIPSIIGFVDDKIRKKWTNVLKKNKTSKILPILLDKIYKLEKTGEHEIMNEGDFDNIFENLDYFDDEIAESLCETNLSTWGVITTNNYWNHHLNELKQYNKLMDIDFDEIKIIFEDITNKYGLKTRNLMKMFHNKNDEIWDVNLKSFLENFNSGKWVFCDKVLRILDENHPNIWPEELNKFFNSEIDICDTSKILKMVKFDDETSKNVRENFVNITQQADQVYVLEDPVTKKKFVDFDEDEIAEWRNKSKLISPINIVESLAILVKVCKLKINIDLRRTQLVSILTMWNNNNNNTDDKTHKNIDQRNGGILMQVSTGEGKTIVAVIFAVLKVLDGEKVDIITSSSVLAQRDAYNEKNQKIFNFFNIKVDHNCHIKMDDRKEAYKCNIVYGTLCNFQRDYLLTEFHEQKLMPEHHFKNIIVDEVDSMLLDKGNNILYLSQDLPDLDEIESIFVFIWQWVNQTYTSIEEASQILNTYLIRKVVLDNIYGILDEEDIKKMDPNVDALKAIMTLKELKILDEHSLIIKENFNEVKISSALCHFGEELTEKIIVYCREKIKTVRQICFPNYLKDFVLHHLDKWIENAIRALHLQNEEQYVVDRSKTEPNEDYADINILDLDTGTDMSNSQWDEGLHQFLQLKYGCKLSPLSLKSVFISNVSFFKKYENLYGMTGTLGNQQERQKIMKIHKIDFITIPRYKTRNFVEYAPIAETNEDEWKKRICEEVKDMIEKCNRSVLIICETIQEVLKVQKTISEIVPKEKILIYKRDSDDFHIDELQPNHVIVSTNLAGRGTDLKLSDDLKTKGGLHVILTNLPDNSRIEEQAFGRAARSGDMGSGRLIICSKSRLPISKLKEIRNQNELRRLDEISSYYENFIKIEEDFFDKFQSAHRELKKNSPNEEAYILNFLIQWSFWLDINSKLLENCKNSMNMTLLEDRFETFVQNTDALHPIMKIELLKELICKDKNRDVRHLLEDNFQDDLFAHQYFKLCEIMRRNQMKNNYQTRDLTDEEHWQIKKCLKMLQTSIDNRKIRVQFIKLLKESKKEYSTIEGFENQQNEILEIFNEIFKELISLMGIDVSPENLGTAEINTELMRKSLYKELQRLECITPPKISKFYTEHDIVEISQRHKINPDDMIKFLDTYKEKHLKSLEDFSVALKENIKLPSRIEFWEILKAKKILINEVEYAIIDINILKNIDPSAEETLKNKYSSERLELSKNKVFFATVNEFFENQDKLKQIDKHKFTIKMESLKSEFSQKRVNYLLSNDVIEVNKEAIFDFERFNSLKKTKIFDNFDKIKRNDFKVICKNYERIINKLTSSELNVLVPCTEDAYEINYENLENISYPYALDDDYVYHSKVLDLLTSNFSYQIALEKLVDDLLDSKFFPSISLDISPQVTLLNDLLSSMIIEHSKVDENKMGKCKDIFKYSNISVDLENAGISCNQKLIEDLCRIQTDIDNGNMNSAIKNIKLSPNYQDIESTVKLLIYNRATLNKNVKIIYSNLTKFIKPLRNKNINYLEITLVPIEKILPQNKFLHFMEVKSLGTIIKIQEYRYRLISYVKLLVKTESVHVIFTLLAKPFDANGLNFSKFSILN